MFSVRVCVSGFWEKGLMAGQSLGVIIRFVRLAAVGFPCVWDQRCWFAQGE